MFPGFPLEPHERKARQMVEIRESSIPGAGRGVFAIVDIPAGTDLGWYRGEAFTHEEFGDRNTDYALTVYRNDWMPEIFKDKGILIDARHKGNWIGIINSPKGTLRPAICYYSEEGRVIIKCNIPKGKEILASYGRAYWNARRNKTTKATDSEKRRKTRKI